MITGLLFEGDFYRYCSFIVGYRPQVLSVYTKSFDVRPPRKCYAALRFRYSTVS